MAPPEAAASPSKTSPYLEYRYHDDAGIYKGSVCCSIYTADNGYDNSGYTASPLYASTISAHLWPRGDGGPADRVSAGSSLASHTRLTASVESVPGRSFGVVLCWRNEKGRLPKSFVLQDDLTVWYWFDGRPYPSMRYAINMPGAQNPLPLSGLWPDESNRYPFLWVARRAVPTRSASTESSDTAARNSKKCGVIPPDSLFAADADGDVGGGDVIVQTPLACVDDLSSIRVTLHRSSEEEKARQEAPTVPGAMPMSHSNSELSSDPRKYSHERLSDAVDLAYGELPKSERKVLREELFGVGDRADSPRTAPFAEFRIYYKDGPTLLRCGLCNLPAQSLDEDMEDGEEKEEEEGEKDVDLGIGTSGQRQLARQAEEEEPLGRTGPDASRSSSTSERRPSGSVSSEHHGSPPESAPISAPGRLLGPLSKRANGAAYVNGSKRKATAEEAISVNSRSQSPAISAGEEVPVHRANRVKREPQEDESGLNGAGDAAQAPTEDYHDPTNFDAYTNDYAEESTIADARPEPACEPAAELPPALSASRAEPEPKAEPAPAAPKVAPVPFAKAEEEGSLPTVMSAYPARQASLAGNMVRSQSQSRPPSVAASAIPARLMSSAAPSTPTPQQQLSSSLASAPNSAASSSSTSLIGATKEQAAFDFLSEPDLDIADEENVAALIGIGFKTKARFIRNMRVSDRKQREKILADLEVGMKLDIQTMRQYLKDNGIELD